MVEKRQATLQARQAQGANRANMAVEVADCRDDAAEVACAATDVVAVQS